MSRQLVALSDVTGVNANNRPIELVERFVLAFERQILECSTIREFQQIENQPSKRCLTKLVEVQTGRVSPDVYTI